jgi:3',5'-cyclic AMP phosphodiesterase CpdA
MEIVHLSDIHLFSLEGLRLAELFTKRLLGILNWYRKRGRLMDHGLLEEAAAQIALRAPDQICITGDLTHLGRMPEFGMAERFLKGLSKYGEVTVVPGNHDFYVEKSRLNMERALGGKFNLPGRLPDFRRAARDPSLAAFFPVSFRRGRVAFFSVCTAFACAPHLAVGAIGPVQLKALGNMLQDDGQRGLFRIVLMHHPPLSGLTKPRRQLMDQAGFLEAVTRQGCELILFGHIHYRHSSTLEHRQGKALVLSAPALCSTAGQHPRRGGYYRISISGGPGRWLVAVEDYLLSRHGGGFKRHRDFSLAL